jgi:hypothetical protein
VVSTPRRFSSTLFHKARKTHPETAPPHTTDSPVPQATS